MSTDNNILDTSQFYYESCTYIANIILESEKELYFNFANCKDKNLINILKNKDIRKNISELLESHFNNAAINIKKKLNNEKYNQVNNINNITRFYDFNIKNKIKHGYCCILSALLSNIMKIYLKLDRSKLDVSNVNDYLSYIQTHINDCLNPLLQELLNPEKNAFYKCSIGKDGNPDCSDADLYKIVESNEDTYIFNLSIIDN